MANSLSLLHFILLLLLSPLFATNFYMSWACAKEDKKEHVSFPNFERSSTSLTKKVHTKHNYRLSDPTISAKSDERDFMRDTGSFANEMRTSFENGVRFRRYQSDLMAIESKFIGSRVRAEVQREVFVSSLATKHTLHLPDSPESWRLFLR
ncbi:hypothetical protein EDD21DRAFT_349996 [Dissophora ornata]|nr:hypothetical protein EDD21DRAFT_349996 [Dissophora ornata]